MVDRSKSAKRSVAKGKAFERLVGSMFREALGLSSEAVHRGLSQARRGGAEVPDIVLPEALPLHVEAKHRKAFSLEAAFAQADADVAAQGATGRLLPLVVYRLPRAREVTAALRLGALRWVCAHLGPRGETPFPNDYAGESPVVRMAFPDLLALLRTVHARRATYEFPHATLG